MKFIYPAIIHDDTDGSGLNFQISNTLSSTSSTLTELITNAQGLWNSHILGALEDGQILPTPTLFAAYRNADTTYPTLGANRYLI